DPSLPSYVGAVPPEDADPWDWDRTWLAPMPGTLLTVSQNPADGGKYRAIGDALAAASPWATIRVLDDAAYAEILVLDDPTRHEGLALEAPRHARLEWRAGAMNVLSVDGIAHVVVRGFRFRGDVGPLDAPFVHITGRCPGVLLENLDIETAGHMEAIALTGLSLQQRETPLLVRSCRIQVVRDGIKVSAPAR